MNTVTRKINLFVGLVQKSPDWIKYYLDYTKKPGSTWIFTAQGLKFILRTHSVDKWIVAENIILDSYKLSGLKATEFDQVFDIGGNIGSFCVSAAKYFKKANITTFEPSGENFKLLKKNISLNGFSDRIKVVQGAVSMTDKSSIRLYQGKDFGSNSTYVSTNSYQDVKNFNLLKIAKPLTSKTLLKVDIEGGEIEIFKKANVQFLKKFKLIILEYHHFLKTHSAEKFEKFLTKNSFKFEKDELIYLIRS